jgi:hypothetical protein
MYEALMHEGLELTRCDGCGSRQWCAVEGTAWCRKCCPAAVEEAQNVARGARLHREQVARLEADARWVERYLPPPENAPIDHLVSCRAVHW